MCDELAIVAALMRGSKHGLDAALMGDAMPLVPPPFVLPQAPAAGSGSAQPCRCAVTMLGGCLVA